jgi:UDP-2-acetamido-2,6-beta-L-arabino-hexul-4-ose reductase
MKIGITGQSGFVGTHLYNFLGLQEGIERVTFKDEYFSSSQSLQDFVAGCDVIVHLAALNRHNDPETIYKTNTGLVKQLTEAMEAKNVRPHVLFSSSSQEELDNIYGKSKKEGRELFISWAEKNKAAFTGLIIPNVFGPFGNPYYNSVVATFCHQLTHGEKPVIQVDGNLKLIFVAELVSYIFKAIKENTGEIKTVKVPHTAESKVSDLLKTLESFRDNYMQRGIIPSLDNSFERNLFITFLCYIDHKNYFPFKLTQHTDERGSFVETVKLNSGGQISFSTTKPGITRGNHFHTRKSERFAVIKGKARIQLRKTGTSEVLEFILDGNEPSYVDMPIWYTHNITNIGSEDLYTIFWISEQYDATDPDTFFEKV